jgi:acyl carrier protein
MTKDLAGLSAHPLDVAPASQRAQIIEDWLTTRIAEMLSVDKEEIDPGEPFANYGLGSYQGVRVAGDLSDWLERDLPETLIWDYPTIQEMADYLSTQPR